MILVYYMTIHILALSDNLSRAKHVLTKVCRAVTYHNSVPALRRRAPARRWTQTLYKESGYEKNCRHSCALSVPVTQRV